MLQSSTGVPDANALVEDVLLAIDEQVGFHLSHGKKG